MSRILVTGAAGVVGHFLLPRLAANGMEVHALSRVPRESANVNWHRADLSVSGWSESLPRIRYVFHLAPLWLLPPLLPELRRLGVRRVVAFGSTSRVTKAASASRAERDLARRLADAETVLAEDAGGMAWTVFRPTLIYGAGLDQNVSGIARFVRRFGFFPVAGRASGLRQPVHADDLADACLVVLDRPATFERVFDLGGGERLAYREMVRRVFVALEQRARILSLPPMLLRAGIGVAARAGRFAHWDQALVDRMAEDMVFDIGPAQAAFGYAPRAFHPTAEDLGYGWRENVATERYENRGK